ncbi:MAG TPA: hypothetical protein VK524_32735 [Polyangiaceae bacterium]|nr:hypothetical protein [Polyangiaceae bacterium]
MVRMMWRTLSASAVFTFAFMLATPARAQECVPQCRSGFLCVQGQCISACNPPCASHDQCTPNGECIAPGPAAQSSLPPQAAAPAPPPAYPANMGYPGAANAGTPNPQPTAQPAYAPLPGPTPPPAEHGKPRGKQPFTHDGFYLQLGLGAGWVSGTAESKGAGGIELNVSGVGQLGHVAMGTTVAPGLVIGGGIFGVNLFAPKYEYGPKGQQNFNQIEEDADFSSATMLGPLIAYYFHPERGAYVVGAPAYGIVSAGASERDTIPENSGGGFGLMLGAGYDFWVGEQWSVGALGRFQYFSAELEDDDGRKADFSALVPGLLITATYH